jgi:hypothetical protein
MSTPCGPATGVPKRSRSAARPRLQPLDQRRQQELRRSRQPRRLKRSYEIACAFHGRVQAPDLGDERLHLVGRVAALDRVELARGPQVGHKPSGGLIPHPRPNLALRRACAFRIDSLVSGPMPKRFSPGLGALNTRAWCSAQYELPGFVVF